jgi:hypothetical protein
VIEGDSDHDQIESAPETGPADAQGDRTAAGLDGPPGKQAHKPNTRTLTNSDNLIQAKAR